MIRPLSITSRWRAPVGSSGVGFPAKRQHTFAPWPSVWRTCHGVFPIILYVGLWICLPRLYLGIHYASDIIVGAAVAVTAVWAALRIDWLRTDLASRVLASMEANPQVFYPAAFLVSYEMASVFSEIRSPMHVVLSAARQGYLHEAGKVLVALATLSVVAIAPV